MSWTLLIMGICGLVSGLFTATLHKRIGRYIYSEEQYAAARLGIFFHEAEWTRFGSEKIASSTFLAGGIIGCIVGIAFLVLAFTL